MANLLVKYLFVCFFIRFEALVYEVRNTKSYIQGEPGFLQVIRTQAWRHKKAGYGKEGCTREHAIRRQSVNVQNKLDECYLQDQNLTECESLPSRYTGQGFNPYLPKNSHPLLITKNSYTTNFFNVFKIPINYDMIQLSFQSYRY